MADASHLIGKRGEPITANRSAPQAASLFFNILDELEERERKKEARERKVRKRAGWDEEKNKKKWSEYKHWDGGVAAQRTDAQEDMSWRASVGETLKWDAFFFSEGH